MNMKQEITGGDFSHIGYISSDVKKILRERGIDSKVIKRVVVSIFEAEVNIAAHAWKGLIEIELGEDSIRIVASDEGPGIESIEMAMKEGFSTASSKVREMGFGAGMGLPNIKNNSDHLDIKSELGKGTTVEIITSLKS